MKLKLYISNLILLAVAMALIIVLLPAALILSPCLIILWAITVQFEEHES
jgi:hypothetical protein